MLLGLHKFIEITVNCEPETVNGYQITNAIQLQEWGGEMSKKNKKNSKGSKTKGTNQIPIAKDVSNNEIDEKVKKKPKMTKMKLSEHTAFKNKDKGKKKNRESIWVKKFTLEYEEELHKLQIELLKWQKHVIANEQRVLMLFEGRDAAGKGGTIKRIIEHLSPRGARVVALLKPKVLFLCFKRGTASTVYIERNRPFETI